MLPFSAPSMPSCSHSVAELSKYKEITQSLSREGGCKGSGNQCGALRGRMVGDTISIERCPDASHVQCHRPPQVMTSRPPHTRVAHGQQLLQRLLSLLHRSTWGQQLPYTQTCTDMYRHVQTRTDTYRHVQTRTDTYRHVQTCTDMYRHVQAHTGTHKHSLDAAPRAASPATHPLRLGQQCPQALPPAAQQRPGKQTLRPPRPPPSAAWTE
jgi:hypothetical protein